MTTHVVQKLNENESKVRKIISSRFQQLKKMAKFFEIVFLYSRAAASRSRLIGEMVCSFSSFLWNLSR